MSPRKHRAPAALRLVPFAICFLGAAACSSSTPAAGGGGSRSTTGTAGAGGAPATRSSAARGGTSGNSTATTASTPPDGGSIDGTTSSPFVKVCGTGLCLHGAPYTIHGATGYGRYDDAPGLVATALAEKVNVIEIIEYESTYHTLSEAMSEPTWQRVDKVIAAAAGAGMHVVLNTSSYGQSLEAAGQKAVSVDWKPFVQFVANRVNTVSGTRYADDPTIALIEVWGEIDTVGCHYTEYNATPTVLGTGAEITDFYSRTLAEWHAADSNHLHATGGFSYLDQYNACGIDWKTIHTDANNDLCAMEFNSLSEWTIAVPAVTALCKALGKPWFLAAWSPGCSTSWGADLTTDAAKAQHAREMYALSRDDFTGLSGLPSTTKPAPAYPSVGADFWNLGTSTDPNGCDVNATFPLTMQVVRDTAP